jgi:hypothetical protein
MLMSISPSFGSSSGAKMLAGSGVQTEEKALRLVNANAALPANVAPRNCRRDNF